MWDVKQYKKAINNIVIDGKINNQPVKYKKDVYFYLSEMIGYDSDTIKGWARPNSKGPNDTGVIRKMEAIFDLPCYKLEDNGQEVINKSAIYRIYELMKNYLRDEKKENEEYFLYMWNEIEKNKILLPQKLYQKIVEFIDNYLAPIVYEREETYSSCYTEEIGFWDEEGIWQVENEDARKLMHMNYVLKNIEIEEQLELFAMKELQPYLI